MDDLQTLQNKLAVLQARKDLLTASSKLQGDSLDKQIAATQAQIADIS